MYVTDDKVAETEVEIVKFIELAHMPPPKIADILWFNIFLSQDIYD